MRWQFQLSSRSRAFRPRRTRLLLGALVLLGYGLPIVGAAMSSARLASAELAPLACAQPRLTFDELEQIRVQIRPNEEQAPSAVDLAPENDVTAVEHSAVASVIDQLVECGRTGGLSYSASLYTPRFLSTTFANTTRERWDQPKDPTFPIFTLLDTSFVRRLDDNRLVTAAVMSFRDEAAGLVVSAQLFVLLESDVGLLIDDELAGGADNFSTAAYPDAMSGLPALDDRSAIEAGCLQPRLTVEQLEGAWEQVSVGITPYAPPEPDLANPVPPDTLVIVENLIEQWMSCSNFLDVLRLMALYTPESWLNFASFPVGEWYRPGATWVYQPPHAFELIDIPFVTWSSDGRLVVVAIAKAEQSSDPIVALTFTLVRQNGRWLFE